MKIFVILPVVWLLVVLNADHVESRLVLRPYHMFVFGDSFADTGNAPKSNLSQDSRQWYYPYGGNRCPRGRLSNGFLQTDFIAKLLGRHDAPEIYSQRRKHFFGSFGMNFAVSGAGVYEVPQKVPTLSEQIDQFKTLIEEGTIMKWRLHRSVALVAISGGDYALVSSANDAAAALVDNVTTEIAKEVKRLQDLGVTKILVNNLQPLGCAPRLARPSNYTRCDDGANAVASIHNKNLKEKLGTDHDNVMILDMNSAFSRIVQPDPATSDEDLAKLIKNKLIPSCESIDPKGYCGQKDENGRPMYTVVDLVEEPFGYFYWDDVHPTHSGWFFVMEQMEEDIKAFLGV